MERTTSQSVEINAYLESASLGVHTLQHGKRVPIENLEFPLYLELVAVDSERNAIEFRVGSGDVEGGPFTVKEDERFEVQYNDVGVSIEIANPSEL